MELYYKIHNQTSVKVNILVCMCNHNYLKYKKYTTQGLNMFICTFLRMEEGQKMCSDVKQGGTQRDRNYL